MTQTQEAAITLQRNLDSGDKIFKSAMQYNNDRLTAFDPGQPG